MKLALPPELIDVMSARIWEILPGAVFVPVDREGHVEGDGQGVEVWLRPPGDRLTEAVLAQMPDLRWLHTPSAGVETVLSPALTDRCIVLTNSAGAYAPAIAESVLAYIFAVSKRLPGHLRNQERSIWQSYEKGELPGKTLGILGLGAIGRTTARMAAALGMRVIGTVRRPRELEGIDAVYGPHEARRVAAESHFLLVAAPSTSATQHLVDETLLRSMRQDAWLINIARGSLVDEAALLRGLQEGWLAGACLDVFEHEPLPPNHPFWRLPNMLITPHNTANTAESSARWQAIFYDNLRRFAAGQELINVVDYEAGY